MGKPRVCGRGTQVTSLALPHSLTLHGLGAEHSLPGHVLGTFCCQLPQPSLPSHPPGKRLAGLPLHPAAAWLRSAALVLQISREQRASQNHIKLAQCISVPHRSAKPWQRRTELGKSCTNTPAASGEPGCGISCKAVTGKKAVRWGRKVEMSLLLQKAAF